MSPVTGLQLETLEQVLSTSTGYVNKITVSGISASDVDLAGYKLYASFDNISYTLLGIYLDVDLIKSGARTYIPQVLTSLYDGRVLYLKVSAFTTYNLESTLSIPTNFETKCTPPTIDAIYFDTKKITLELSELPTSTGMNSSFANYRITKYSSRGLSYTVVGSSDTTLILASDDFVVGDIIRVEHISLNMVWEGVVEDVGFFELNDSNKLINDYLLTYTRINLGDLNVYAKNILIASVDTNVNIYDDPTFVVGIVYFYEVSTLTSTTESLLDINSVASKDLTDTSPVLRLLEQSNITTLKESWRQMKLSLWDSNYYDQRNLALPYFNGNTLNLLLYVGMYNIRVDIWLNDAYLGLYSTNKSGEVTIPVVFRKGDNVVKIRIANDDSTIVNVNTYTFNLTTYLKYLPFAVFGILLGELETEIINSKAEIFLSSATLLNRFSDLASVFRIFGWTADEYKEVMQALFLAFKYNATMEGIERVIEAFHMVDTFWIWEYLEPERTIRVGDMCTSTGLINRENYLYGVSACKVNGEETTPTLIRIDNRWHSPNYYTISILEWDVVAGTDFYKIYRTSSGGTTLGLLSTTIGLRFLDRNTVAPDFNINPLTLNYSSMSIVQNLERVTIPKVRDLEFYYFSGGTIKIVIGTKRELFDKEKELLFSLIRRIIPCELRLILFIGTDTTAYRLDQKYERNYGFDA